MQQTDPYALTLLFVGLTLLAAGRLGLTFMVKPSNMSHTSVRRHVVLTVIASIVTLAPMTLCWKLFGTSPVHIWQGARTLWSLGVAEASITACAIAAALTLVLLTPVLVAAALLKCTTTLRRARATA